MPQERYPAKALAALLEESTKASRISRRRGAGLRLSAKDAAKLGIQLPEPAPGSPAAELAAQKSSRAIGWDPFDPQVLLTQALRQRLAWLGEGAVREEVQNLIPGRRYRADIVIDAARLVIEFDGFAYHRSKQAFQKDRERQNAFTQAGWNTLRFFHAQVRNHLEAVVDQVEAFVREKALPDETA